VCEYQIEIKGYLGLLTYLLTYFSRSGLSICMTGQGTKLMIVLNCKYCVIIQSKQNVYGPSAVCCMRIRGTGVMMI